MTSPVEKPSSRKFQAPKGTRDFYPQDMAVRRYIEGVWRQTSINHGFDEIEGPMFEDIDLYTHKSGPGIVSEIFQVFSGKDEKELAKIRAGGDAPFALRPEFTPTLARMVAAKAAELPRPIKWFAIPQHFRAERPQRGRLREFMQWNVDFIGDATPQADAEVIATAVAALASFGLTPHDLRVRISNRALVAQIALVCGAAPSQIPQVLDFLDKRGRLPPDEALARARVLMPFYIKKYDEIVSIAKVNFASVKNIATGDYGGSWTSSMGSIGKYNLEFEDTANQFLAIKPLGILEWCEPDFSIVRGLAYYTGTVFEIIAEGERAIAGGGRYDNLIESFGGPALPACGFGMGDVVLANILHDKNLLPEEVYMKPLRPHAFAIALDDAADPIMRQTVAQLRRDGYHVRHSYKTTRNVGKLLGDASKSRAMSAIVFGKDIASQRVDFKDLQSGEQTTISINELKNTLKDVIAKNE